MSENSYYRSCLNAFAAKSVLGAGVGIATSFFFKSNKRFFIIFMCAGIGGGLASYECEGLYKRLAPSHSANANKI